MEISNQEELGALDEYEGMLYMKSDHEVEEHGGDLSESDIDSDIENFLYGQANYSAQLKFNSDGQNDVTTESVISDVNVEGGKSEAEINITFPELVNDAYFPSYVNIDSRKEKTTGSLKKDDVTVVLENWDIIDSDLKGKCRIKSFGHRNSPRYYIENQPNTHCYNCNTRGHLSRDCSNPKKEDLCFLCGGKGHIRWKCPNDVCYNCRESGHTAKKCTISKRKYWERCQRCRTLGHSKDGCPEIWRQYHLTIDDGTIIKTTKKDRYRKMCQSKNCFCYNCGHEGHWGHECTEPKQFRRQSQSPFIVHYDKCPFVAENTDTLLNNVTLDNKATDAKYENSTKAKADKEEKKTDKIVEKAEVKSTIKKIVKLKRKKAKIQEEGQGIQVELEQNKNTKADTDVRNDQTLDTSQRKKLKQKKRKFKDRTNKDVIDTINKDIVDLTRLDSDQNGGERREKVKKTAESYVTISDSDQNSDKKKEKIKKSSYVTSSEKDHSGSKKREKIMKPVDSYVTISDPEQSDGKKIEKVKKSMDSYVTSADKDQSGSKKKEKIMKPVDIYVTISDSDQSDGKKIEMVKKPVHTYVTSSDKDQSGSKKKEKMIKLADSYVNISDSDQSDDKKKEMTKPFDSYVTSSSSDSDQSDDKKKEKIKKPYHQAELDGRNIQSYDKFKKSSENNVSINISSYKDHEETSLSNSVIWKDVKKTEDISKKKHCIHTSGDETAAKIGDRIVRNLQKEHSLRIHSPISSDFELLSDDDEDLRTSINNMKAARNINRNGEVTFENDDNHSEDFIVTMEGNNSKDLSRDVDEEPGRHEMPEFITIDATGTYEKDDCTRYHPGEIAEDHLSYYGLSSESLNSKKSTPQHVFFAYEDAVADANANNVDGNVSNRKAFTGNIPRNKFRKWKGKRQRESTNSTDPNGKRQRKDTTTTTSRVDFRKQKKCREKELKYLSKNSTAPHGHGNRQWINTTSATSREENRKQKSKERKKKKKDEKKMKKKSMQNNNFFSNSNSNAICNNKNTFWSNMSSKKGRESNETEFDRERKNFWSRGFRSSNTAKQIANSYYM